MKKDAIRSTRRMTRLDAPKIMKSINEKGRLNTAGDLVLNKNIIKGKHDLFNPREFFKSHLVDF